MKSREQQVEEVHALLRELGREEGSERAAAVLENVKAFDFTSARYAAECFDLDGVRQAVEGFDRLRESQGDRAVCAIYDFGPLHKALARFDKVGLCDWVVPALPLLQQHLIAADFLFLHAVRTEPYFALRFFFEVVLRQQQVAIKALLRVKFVVIL